MTTHATKAERVYIVSETSLVNGYIESHTPPKMENYQSPLATVSVRINISGEKLTERHFNFKEDIDDFLDVFESIFRELRKRKDYLKSRKEIKE